MDALEFFQQALLRSLPEAVRSERGKSPEQIAARAKEIASAACGAAGVDPPPKRRGRPPGRPKTEKL